MHISLGVLGHTLTFEITFSPDEEPESASTVLSGGSEGLFERCLDSNLEYVEGDPWEQYEDRAKRTPKPNVGNFGFT